MALGTVKWFDRTKGCGFVVPDAGGQDLYVHRVSIAGDLRLTLAAGDRLEFETRAGGLVPEAVNVVSPTMRRPVRRKPRALRRAVPG